MILKFLNNSQPFHHHDEANNCDNAKYVYSANIANQFNGTPKQKYVHIVSSDFAYPAITGRLNRNNLDPTQEPVGATVLGPLDGISGTPTTGLQIHGGGFGNTFGTTATISAIDTLSGATATSITSSVGAPKAIVDNTRFFFGDLTGEIIASFALPPLGTMVFSKKPGDKIFSTPGIEPSSGNASSSTGVFFTKVDVVSASQAVAHYG